MLNEINENLQRSSLCFEMSVNLWLAKQEVDSLQYCYECAQIKECMLQNPKKKGCCDHSSTCLLPKTQISLQMAKYKHSTSTIYNLSSLIAK